MVSRHPSKNQPVQIDTDWLLGPEPEVQTSRKPNSRTEQPVKRTRWVGRSLSLLALLGTVGLVGGYWETASAQILTWQWQKILASSNNEEAIATMVEMNAANPDAETLLIRQLQSDHNGRRAVAFELLKPRLEPTALQRLPASKRDALIHELSSLSDDNSELLMMRGFLASRLLSSMRKEDPALATQCQQLQIMIDAASQVALIHRTPTAPTSLANASSSPVRQRISDDEEPSPTTPEIMAVMKAAPDPTSVASLSPALPPLPPSSLHAKPLSPNGSNSLSDQREQRIDESSAPAREPLRIRVGSQRIVHPVSTSSSAPQSSPRDLAIVEEPKPNPSEKPRDESTESVNTTSLIPANSLRKQSTEQILRLLESHQDSVVTQALQELEARGFSERNLEIAMELARGTSEERLAALDRLVHDSRLDPLPWLSWMAGTTDRDVRMRAIALLGATADEEALRKLRLMKQREVDQRVSDQITQVLLAAGSVQSKRR